MNKLDYQYLGLVNEVVNLGEWQDTRTQFRAKSIPFVNITVDIGQDENGIFTNFPLLTTKRVAFKTMSVELEGFIKGVTNKSWYQERGCKIWDSWCNPAAIEDHIYMREFSYDESMTHEEATEEYNSRKKAAQKEINDLGPIYGYQWRKFGEDYPPYDENDVYNGIPKGQGTDQLKSIVETLKTNPNDRRMVCSAWNPNQFHLMALPPCHILWHVVVINGVLHLGWYQRSCDLMLGVPFNIASYALLMCLLCKESGLKPGKLHGTLANCHIYENQMNGAIEQLTRDAHPLPKLDITNFSDIYNWSHKDCKLIDYQYEPAIDFGEVAV